MRVNGYVSAKSLPVYEALMEAISGMFKQWKSFNDDPGTTYGIMCAIQIMGELMAKDGTKLDLVDEPLPQPPANYD